MHAERRFARLDSKEEEAEWCVVDGDKIYPFGPKSSAYGVLESATNGTDIISGYGTWPSNYGISEIEWCKHQVKKKYPYSWGFLNWERDAYLVYRGDGNNPIAREPTELEAWRAAEEIVAIEGGRRAKIEIPTKTAKPVELYGPWVTISDFSVGSKDWEPNTYYSYGQTDSSGLLCGQLRGEEDGERPRISSTCRNCCFTDISARGMVTCESCGSYLITHVPISSFGSWPVW